MKLLIFLALVLLVKTSFALTPNCQAQIDEQNGISRDCAIEVLIDNGYALKNINEGAFVFSIPTLYPKGSTFESGIQDGEYGQTLTRDTWFFFVDYAPGSFWQHSAEGVFVDYITAELNVVAMNSYPKLDRVSFFIQHSDYDDPYFRIPGFTYNPLLGSPLPVVAPLENLTTYPKDKNDPRFASFAKYENESDENHFRRFQGRYESQQSYPSAITELTKCKAASAFGACSETITRRAVVIDGGNLLGGAEDAVAISNALKKGGVIVRTLVSELQKDSDAELTTIANIEKNLKWLGDNTLSCCDEALIYIHAHGLPNGHMQMNPVTAIEVNHTTHQVKITGSPEGGMYSHARLVAALNRIKTCHTRIFIMSCFAGSQLEAQNGVASLLEIPADNKDCMCRTVFATSSARQVTRSGGTKQVIEALNAKPAYVAGFVESALAYKKIMEVGAGKDGNQSSIAASSDCKTCEDTDKDGFIDGYEFRIGTNPLKEDTDDDDLTDREEHMLYKTLATNPDTDDDKLKDGEEVKVHNSDPFKKDTDDDGLEDKMEILATTNPRMPDSDVDGLKDGEEVYKYGTQPRKFDTDGDKFSDGWEVQEGTDPLDKNSYPEL